MRMLEGGYLVTITSEEENRIVDELVTPHLKNGERDFFDWCHR